MASISIQGRVDDALWKSIKRDDETNTDVLQRIAAHFVATSAAELQQIAPTSDAAIAVLLNSHRLLNQLMQNAAIALPSDIAAAPVAPTETEVTTERSAIACADDW